MAKRKEVAKAMRNQDQIAFINLQEHGQTGILVQTSTIKYQ